MRGRAAFRHADRCLRERRLVYVLVLFLAIFVTVAGLHLSFGASLGTALLQGLFYGGVFALTFGLLSSVVEPRRD